MVFGAIPDAFGRHAYVAMDQHVAKVDDRAISQNPFDEIGMRFPKAVHRLADDLELAFDCSLRQRIPGICVTVDPFGEALDFRACPLDIRQQDARVRRHRQARATG